MRRWASSWPGSSGGIRSEEHTSELQSNSFISYAVFFFNDTATTEIYTLSLHDALPISMIPVAGSAYTYTYATMGKFLAWIIGWNLVLEYLAAASTVAVGWSGYFVELMAQAG